MKRQERTPKGIRGLKHKVRALMVSEHAPEYLIDPILLAIDRAVVEHVIDLRFQAGLKDLVRNMMKPMPKKTFRRRKGRRPRA